MTLPEAKAHITFTNTINHHLRIEGLTRTIKICEAKGIEHEQGTDNWQYFSNDKESYGLQIEPIGRSERLF